MEKTMMDLMFRIPSDETMTECIVTKESVLGESAPIEKHAETEAPKKKTTKKKLEVIKNEPKKKNGISKR